MLTQIPQAHCPPRPEEQPLNLRVPLPRKPVAPQPPYRHFTSAESRRRHGGFLTSEEEKRRRSLAQRRARGAASCDPLPRPRCKRDQHQYLHSLLARSLPARCLAAPSIPTVTTHRPPLQNPRHYLQPRNQTTPSCLPALHLTSPTTRWRHAARSPVPASPIGRCSR